MWLLRWRQDPVQGALASWIQNVLLGWVRLLSRVLPDKFAKIIRNLALAMLTNLLSFKKPPSCHAFGDKMVLDKQLYFFLVFSVLLALLQ